MSLSLQYILALVAVALTIAAFRIYRQCSMWQRHNIPHLPEVPILGSSYVIFTRKVSIANFLEDNYRKFAEYRYFGTSLFGTPNVMVRDPELIKDITVKSFEHFTDHRVFLNEDMDPILGKNVFSLRGDEWRQMRNTLSPSFTASKMRFMYPLVCKCSENFVGHLAEHPEMCGAIELKEAFARYTNDVIATVAFGIDVDSLKHPDNAFYMHGRVATNFGSRSRVIKLVLYRIIPKLMRLFRVKIFPDAMRRFFKDVIAETIATREKQGIERPDMVHLLTVAKGKDGANLSIDDMTAQAFIFFLAGFEASSTFACFLAHEIAMNPDVQERLHAEVRRHVVDGKITYEDLHKMEYMDMVCSEALRKYPPVAFIDRLCVKDYRLPPTKDGAPEFVVRKDMSIWIPVFAIHRDARYYPNPGKFDPERFSEANKDKVDPYTFLPFGVGPRKCIGNRLALMESKILVANLVQKFRLKPCEKTVDPIVFNKKMLNLLPEHGFWISLEIRK